MESTTFQRLERSADPSADGGVPTAKVCECRGFGENKKNSSRALFLRLLQVPGDAALAQGRAACDH